jgi:hypothetical protein
MTYRTVIKCIRNQKTEYKSGRKNYKIKKEKILIKGIFSFSLDYKCLFQKFYFLKNLAINIVYKIINKIITSNIIPLKNSLAKVPTIIPKRRKIAFIKA